MKKQYNFTGAQDWSGYFKKIFEVIEVNTILEFGLGVGTEFLCDNAKSVVSVELSTGNFNKEWTEKTKDQLKDYTNWSLNYIQIPKEIEKANQDAIKKQYPLEDLSYLPILNKLVNFFLNIKNYDIIFVDPGIHNRGDIVNLCFGKADIIAAHDTDRTGRVIKNIYGYNIVNVPEDYIEIHFNDTYMGTTFWINKKYKNLDLVINALNCCNPR